MFKYVHAIIFLLFSLFWFVRCWVVYNNTDEVFYAIVGVIHMISINIWVNLILREIFEDQGRVSK